MQHSLHGENLSAQRLHVPRVSIGMPVFNAENYIGQAIDSLLLQTFRDFELIISDNASTDGTEAICRQYENKDTRIHYVRQPRNLGAAANFAFVLDKAQGAYFMWAAADDFWMPRFIAETFKLLEKNERAACAVTKVLFSDGNLSKATATLMGSARNRIRDLVKDPSDGSRFYGLYRVDVVRRSMSMVPWDCWAGDWLIVAAAAVAGDILEVPEVLMKRTVAEADKYFLTLVKEKSLTSWFPLLPFSLRVLRFRETWSLGVFLSLLKLNVNYHIDMMRVRKSFLYYVYRVFYRAFLKNTSKAR